MLYSKLQLLVYFHWHVNPIKQIILIERDTQFGEKLNYNTGQTDIISIN